MANCQASGFKLPDRYLPFRWASCWGTVFSVRKDKSRRGHHFRGPWPEFFSLFNKASRDRHVSSGFWAPGQALYQRAVQTAYYSLYSELLHILILASDFNIFFRFLYSLCWNFSDARKVKKPIVLSALKLAPVMLTQPYWLPPYSLFSIFFSLSGRGFTCRKACKGGRGWIQFWQQQKSAVFFPIYIPWLHGS